MSLSQSSSSALRVALLLTNRLVDVAARPLTAREFWSLAERDSVDLADLADLDATQLATVLEGDEHQAHRLRTLLDASRAFSFEAERLDDGGVAVISALDQQFPAGLRERLGPACPPFVLVAGPDDWPARVDRAALGIVGSRDAPEPLLTVARRAGEYAVAQQWAVVSGMARGIDLAGIDGALTVGGMVVGIPADGILRASRNADVRARVHAGELCIISPYAPDAAFTAGTAMGRNKIIYALSRLSLVVSCVEGSGGSWNGAIEALDHGYGTIAAWTGEAAAPGSHALVRRGAHSIGALDAIATTDPAITRTTSDSLF